MSHPAAAVVAVPAAPLEPPAAYVAPVAAGPDDAPAAATDARCLTCDAALAGEWCHRCGTPRPDTRPLTVARFAHDLAHEVTSLDSATMATFRALFTRPGLLTAAYVGGQTRRFLSPVRIYLLTFAAMMVILSLTPAGNPYDARRFSANIHRNEAQRADIARLYGKAAASVGRTADGLVTEASTRMARMTSSPWLHLLDPLAVAGLVALLYRGRRRGYAEHVVFAVHALAFNSILTIVTVMLHDAATPDRKPLNVAISLLHWAILGTYFYRAARTVHGESPARTGVKTIGFVVGSQIAYAIVPIVALATTIVQIFVLRV